MKQQDVSIRRENGLKIDMEKLFVAVFIDIENIPGKIKLERLMNTLILSEQSNYNIVFAVKAAYGVMSSIPSELKIELRDFNYYTFETPRISGKKNRADLFISIDAFETLYVGNPPIDRYVFMTSDSDFTVVMDKLRKYGKEVWLVCRKDDQARAILAKSCDKMLFIEDFFEFPDDESKKEYIKDLDVRARKLCVEMLESIEAERLPYNISVINDRMKQLDRSFDIKHTSYKKFIDLVRHFQDKEIIKLEERESGLIRLVDIDVIKLSNYSSETGN